MKSYIFYFLITLFALQSIATHADNTIRTDSESVITQNDTEQANNSTTGVFLLIVILQILIIGLFYKVNSGLNRTNVGLELEFDLIQEPEESITPKKNKYDWGKVSPKPKPILNLQNI